MNCNKAIDKLSDYIGGRLDRQEVITVFEHLSKCFKCREILIIQCDFQVSYNKVIDPRATYFYGYEQFSRLIQAKSYSFEKVYNSLINILKQTASF